MSLLRLRGGANRAPIVLSIDELEYLIDQLPAPPQAVALRQRLTGVLRALRSGAEGTTAHAVPGSADESSHSSRQTSVNGKGYRVPALTVDAAVVRGAREALEVLLVTRGHEPYQGKLAFPGGFVEYNEDPEDAVLRELYEECSLRGKHPQLVAVRGNPKRDPRQHTCTICYYVDPVDPNATVRGGDDAADAKWYSMDMLLKDPQGKSRLAFDHGELLAQLAVWLDRQRAR